MAKKKFNLTSDIIDTTPNRIQEVKRAIAHTEMTSLTLRVPKLFLKEFKSWCAMQDITMSKALELMYTKHKNINPIDY